MNLDDKDRELLKLLTRNARVTNRVLAQSTGLSESACHARIRRLEGAGVILGYRALLSSEPTGVSLEGWADVRLVEPTAEALETFLRLVRDSEAIVEAHQVAGHYDFVLRFVASGISAWRSFQQNLEHRGCRFQARFSVLIEPLK